jgi:hypothetical protein
VYISFLAPFPRKTVFKSEFYLRFVSFGIRVSHHVKYGIRCN